MGKVFFNIGKATPDVIVSSDGLRDPLRIRTTQALGGFGALPPYFLLRDTDGVRTADADEIRSEMTTVGTIKSVMPLRLKRSTDGILNWFTFPLEPLVSISGKNEIIRRTPAKGKGTGTVMERWSQGDYEISIQGIFIAAENEYPKESVQQLRNLFDTASHLDVEHDILLLFGITRLAIESVSFPHTKGLQNQNYEIKAYSDNPVSLFIPV